MALKRKNKRKKKLKYLRPVFYLCLWLLILGSFGFAFNAQWARYSALLRQEAVISANIRRAEERNSQLLYDLEFYDSDAFIEKIAREQLGLVREYETLYINIAR